MSSFAIQKAVANVSQLFRLPRYILIRSHFRSEGSSIISRQLRHLDVLPSSLPIPQSLQILPVHFVMSYHQAYPSLYGGDPSEYAPSVADSAAPLVPSGQSQVYSGQESQQSAQTSAPPLQHVSLINYPNSLKDLSNFAESYSSQFDQSHFQAAYDSCFDQGIYVPNLTAAALSSDITFNAAPPIEDVSSQMHPNTVDKWWLTLEKNRKVKLASLIINEEAANKLIDNNYFAHLKSLTLTVEPRDSSWVAQASKGWFKPTGYNVWGQPEAYPQLALALSDTFGTYICTGRPVSKVPADITVTWESSISPIAHPNSRRRLNRAMNEAFGQRPTSVDTTAGFKFSLTPRPTT
ncbi:uncharacterized protein I303_108516 [Kwoniella dejecticola CBS 10117]|uniref:Uncharacterized protein n=1 Tax=Kwoniella dejecticola CBS 10117 TaxID=1296121 RepID=A0A1A5ZX68_9TREE|nr:uncharacterized protein I303_07160 [Kwoniella dejecticola CBS 10117]OBR82401.1 hypothetical protein I303_07160 [Kwoniella dejecticola CBS 10117]